MRRTAIFRIIGIAACLAIVVMANMAKVKSYHVAPFVLLPVIWAIYAIRNRLILIPLHFALVCSAILLHMLGAFGFYQHSPLPFSFDMGVHFYFAFAITLPIHRLIRLRLPFTSAQAKLATIVIIMALGALHEVMEYSTLLLGDETAMLKANSYPWDTNRDLTSNLLGCLTALFLVAIFEWRSRNSTAD